MTLLKPATFCITCGSPVKGRQDKVFCCVSCKSKYHYRRRLERREVTYPIDQILHRNWVVLKEAHELARKRKFYADLDKLQKEGFRPEYYTTSRVNANGKVYRYVYEYGWMQFSEKALLVIKLDKPL